MYQLIVWLQVDMGNNSRRLGIFESSSRWQWWLDKITGYYWNCKEILSFIFFMICLFISHGDRKERDNRFFLSYSPHQANMTGRVYFVPQAKRDFLLPSAGCSPGGGGGAVPGGVGGDKACLVSNFVISFNSLKLFAKSISIP